MASVDMKKLLALPQRERRRIAEKLLESLHNISPEEKKAVAAAEERWQEIKSGKSKTISTTQFWKNMNTHVQKKKK